PESRKAKFWRTFLRSRLVRYRKMFMPEKSELSPDCVFPSSFFSMDWFNKQVGSFDKPTRAFGIEIASLYLKEWISRQTFGFRALKPLLFSRHQDVRKFILRAIKNPASEHEYIDITHADFKPEELYEFCLDSNSLIRVTGMEIIQQYPERFGQPDKLIMLASSDDASVRALVVRTIWDLVFISDVTYDWQPTAESVLPQAAKAGAKGYINPIEQLPPSKDAPQVKGVKYLGKGTSQQRTLKLESYTELEDFVRRQLFRLPPNRAGESNAELRARKESGMPPLSPGRIPSWQDKKRLMRIIRDMSIKDKNLATQMVPLFKEFLLFKGKFLKHEALTALVRIEKAHDISIFS
ncbi:MAG: hypothetical protein VX278_23470, partial [Myxococcota bacterium]|nr:hypothetical protein [Myxococcota bacterium]